MYDTSEAIYLLSQENKDISGFTTENLERIEEALEEMKLLKVIDAARHGGHKNSVNKLIWTSFDNQLISGSDDKNISVWKITMISSIDSVILHISLHS